MNVIRTVASFALLSAQIGILSTQAVQAAVEPTVIAERHYTSGQAERHQRTSPTLPAGAPIPDSPAFTSSTPGSNPTVHSDPNATNTATAGNTPGGITSNTIPTPQTNTPGLKQPEELGRVEGPKDMNICRVEPTALPESYATPIGDQRKLSGKVDPTLLMRLNVEERNETNKFILKLSVSDCSPDVIKQLKDVKHLRVVTVHEKNKEIVIEAPAIAVSEIVEISAVKFISR